MKFVERLYSPDVDLSSPKIERYLRVLIGVENGINDTCCGKFDEC